MFMKNFTIAGGFLLLAVTGPGKFSIDHLLNKNGNSDFIITLITLLTLFVCPTYTSLGRYFLFKSFESLPANPTRKL